MRRIFWYNEAVTGGRRCWHCGRPDPAGGPTVDDRERELWDLVDEAEQIRAAAPPAPARAELVSARDALLGALALRERVARQVALVEEALRRPASWLRPVQRGRLVGQLRDRRVAEEAARERVERGQARFAQLRREALRRRDYLAGHRETLSSARAARAELDQRIDELIDGYARMPHPPAWFRFGLGYPPGPEEQADWLCRAREEIGKRRRYGAGTPGAADPVAD
jgi:hypothetical protein